MDIVSTVIFWIIIGSLFIMLLSSILDSYEFAKTNARLRRIEMDGIVAERIARTRGENAALQYLYEQQKSYPWKQSPCKCPQKRLLNLRTWAK